MELLGYVLGIFGLFIFTKGIKPTIEFINKTTEKELVKFFGLMAIFATLIFYVWMLFNFLSNRFKTIYLKMKKLLLYNFIVLTSCKTDVKKEKTYQLIWSDEFNQEEKRLDSSKWFLETIAPNNGSWYNNELQHYTDRIDNAYVSNGTLKIVAKKEEFQSSGTTKLYTSARLNSKLSFTYGKVEVSAKLPRGKGTWPAIWTLGSNFETVTWPACGEIDIMEQLFEDFEMVQCAVHTPDTYGDNTIVKQINVTDVTENFHTYGLEWTKKTSSFMLMETIISRMNQKIKLLRIGLILMTNSLY